MDINLERGMLYQKIGLAKSLLAMELLSKNEGDRIPPISEYQERFGVSRGTMQNAFSSLKDCKAVMLEHHGHQGTYIAALDYAKLQENCVNRQLMGIMPLPYSVTYEGFATALYHELSLLNFNMAYARGAVGRIQLVEEGTYQFAICSKYAAVQSIKDGAEIEIALDFGAGSFLSKHVLLLRTGSECGILDGMKVAYDSNSLDQSRITERLIADKKVTLVNIKTQQTISALKSGKIDAGVWNYDDVLEHQYEDIKPVFIPESEYNNQFSTAVLVVKKGEEHLKTLLKKHINVERVLDILSEVREKKREPFY